MMTGGKLSLLKERLFNATDEEKEVNFYTK
jgi:hypothetical protein